MSKPSPLPDHQYLKHLLYYDPKTGIFQWRLNTINTKPGMIAGHTTTRGYLGIGIEGKSYPLHRIAWKYVYGFDPKESIDHKNGVKKDNRICNLREASHMENIRNRKRLKSYGFKGVSPSDKKFRATMWFNNKSLYLGLFSNPEDAARAYDEAAKKIHGKFANLNFPTP